ncbi:MAG: hypothetical protein OEY69_00075 [Candidatus Krumholzibacteria bacterium]|nr:hypothetical protein [Candidatus Krumholzibacteria bacterium]
MNETTREEFTGVSAVHRQATPDAMRRAVTQAMSTRAVRRHAEEAIRQRALGIEDFRQMVRDECSRPLEFSAMRRQTAKPQAIVEELATLVEQREAGDVCDLGDGSGTD